MDRFLWRKRNKKSYPTARSSANPLPFEEKVSVPAQWNDWRFTGKYLILNRSLYRFFRCLKNHKLMLPIVPHRHPSPDRQRTSSLHDAFPPKKTKPWKINLKFVALCRPPRGCFVLLLFGSLFLILHISPDKPVSSTLYRKVLESQRMGIYIFVFLLAPSWTSWTLNSHPTVGHSTQWEGVHMHSERERAVDKRMHQYLHSIRWCCRWRCSSSWNLRSFPTKMCLLGTYLDCKAGWARAHSRLPSRPAACFPLKTRRRALHCK